MGGERGAEAGPRRAVGGAKPRGAEAGPIGAARAGRRYCDVTGGRIRRRGPRPSPRPLAPAPPLAGAERDPGAAVAHGPGPGAARRAEAMTEQPDVRFITEERFDFSVLSPADSREEDEEDEEAPGGAGVRWSPLSGAQLEEMVREATRLAAQLQHSHPPPMGPGPAGGGSPRNPRRETFVVKDSPVRELLPTVPPAREASQRRGVALLPPPQPVHPAPGPPPLPSPSPAAAPPHPVPSPSPPGGLGRWGRHQAGGAPPGPAWWHREVQGRPLGGLVQGAEQPPPAAACAPPGRQRPAAPCGDGVGAPGETEARGREQQCPPPRSPKRRRQRLRLDFALITKGRTSSRKPPRPLPPHAPRGPSPPPASSTRCHPHPGDTA
uniref:Uncharacterized protein n=1 Tax=Cairina moschata TaxID=8855 RepID=A0A8C3BXH2_CAIMO